MPDGDQPLLVGVDAGTSRIRALVFTPDGRLQAEGAATPRTHRPRPGWAEYTAGDLWHATAAALRAAISKLGRPERIVAVGVASVGEAFVPLDQNLEPTAPVIAWYDERAREELSELHDRLGFEHVTATTGLCPDPIFTLLKLLWMKRHQPEMLARTTLWLNIAHFLAWRLGGRPAADLSLASRTLALDLQTRRWADELIRAAGIEPAIFPPIQPAGQRLGEVSGLAAAATSLPQGAAIGLGVHDHIAGALAIGALRRGVLMDSIGTAEALTLALDRPVPGIRLATAGFSQGVVEVDRGPLAYAFGGLPGAGASIEWFREALADGRPYQELIGAARKVAPGAGGVTFIPDLRGRLSPTTDPKARGAFLGLRADHDRATLFRAVLEGLAMELRQTFDVLDQVVQAGVSEVRAIGGGTRNPLLLELKATLYGRRILACEMSEATALGAALLGGLAAGAYDSLDRATAALDLPFRSVDPNPGWQPIYERHLAEVYRPALHALRPIDHRVADLYG